MKDAIAFVRYFAGAIAVSAPHVYISALAFAPKSSKIAQLYAPRFKNIIQVVVGQLDDWPSEQAVICGHSWGVNPFFAGGGVMIGLICFWYDRTA